MIQSQKSKSDFKLVDREMGEIPLIHEEDSKEEKKRKRKIIEEKIKRHNSN